MLPPVRKDILTVHHAIYFITCWCFYIVLLVLLVISHLMALKEKQIVNFPRLWIPVLYSPSQWANRYHMTWKRLPASCACLEQPSIKARCSCQPQAWADPTHLLNTTISDPSKGGCATNHSDVEGQWCKTWRYTTRMGSRCASLSVAWSVFAWMQ